MQKRLSGTRAEDVRRVRDNAFMSLVWIVVATAIAMGIDCPAFAQAEQNNGQRDRNGGGEVSQLGNIEPRGKDLRAAIDKIYQEMPVMPKPRFVPLSPGPDISETVKQFIPVGTSFDEAEAILEHSGFTIVQPRKETRPSHYTDILSTYDVWGELRFVAGIEADQMGVRVGFRPQKTMDYGSVGEVMARIYKKEQ